MTEITEIKNVTNEQMNNFLASLKFAKGYAPQKAIFASIEEMQAAPKVLSSSGTGHQVGMHIYAVKVPDFKLGSIVVHSGYIRVAPQHLELFGISRSSKVGVTGVISGKKITGAMPLEG